MTTMTFNFTITLNVPEGGPTQTEIVNRVCSATHYDPEDGITKQRHYEKVIGQRLRGDYIRGLNMETESANGGIVVE